MIQIKNLTTLKVIVNFKCFWDGKSPQPSNFHSLVKGILVDN